MDLFSFDEYSITKQKYLLRDEQTLMEYWEKFQIYTSIDDAR